MARGAADTDVGSSSRMNSGVAEANVGICGGINSRELRFSRAMIFAIEEINNSTELLPGIKLGYQIYDSCGSVPVAVHVAFQLSGGLDPVFYTGNNCSQSGKVMAIVGESGSTPSISMSRIIGPFNIPQVSHFATCACLSDKQQYPSFFRTIPSDQFQADALAKLVKHFGWTWIGAIRSDSDYGNNGMASFLNAAHKEAIVIVAFTSPGDLRILLEELSLKPSPPRQWIGSEAWVTAPALMRFNFCAGAVGFGIERSVIPGLRDFVLDVSPSKVAASPVLTEFWEDAFNCRLGKKASTDKTACDGTEDLGTIQSPYTDTSQLRITNMVYKAVYAIAHAIHNAVCQETHSITQCDKLSSIESKQELWPNGKRDTCLPKPVEFLSFNEALGIILAAFSVGGACLAIITAAVFHRHRTSPIVRANNSELSFLLLFSLTLCFLCSLTFIGAPSEWSCMLRHTAIVTRELRFSRAMIFAIEEINNSTELLPGIKLGYQIYDSCASVPVAVHVAFQLSGGMDPVFYTGDNCSQSGKVMAIIGESGSTPSISMSRIIGPFNIPQVSYFATCACLSDKQQYPSFFRTIPSDQFQADALAKLVKHFGWTWIGAIRSDSDYGNNGMASFLNAAHKEGICVEYSESFYRTHPRSRIQRVADIIRRSTAIVIVAFTSPRDMRILLEELSLKPFPPRQWIGSESWVTDPDMLRFSFCAGAVGFGIEQSVIPGLRDFLLDFSPSKVSDSTVFTELWEDAFNCRLGKNASTDKTACDGTEDLETIQSPYTDTSQLRITNMVYKAVYAIAHAIHNAVCQETHSITQCDKLSSIESKQVLTQLKKVNFSKNGDHVSFDANGDPVATYELVNWQKTESGSLDLVVVGHYDASLPMGQELRINKNLTWVEGGTQAVKSIIASELRYSRAMIFAIEEINNSTELLPGIKLGYQIYDSCASVPVAVHVAFQLSGGMDPVFYTGNNCSQSGKVMAIVGESGSTPSISMSRIIGPFDIPQVSHFATCACLSDKQQYPSFFRTIPSDQFQADALAKLVKHFGWTWIGAIRSDSDYGNNGMASFLNAAHKEGICVEYSESFYRTHPRSRIQRVADIIRRSTAIVIVAFTSAGDMRILLEELSLKPSPPRQWIGSESWVLTQLKKVNFSKNAYHVSFDANGDPVATYELVNWQKTESGSLEMVVVGHYDASLSVGQELRINKNLTWVEGGTQLPSPASIICPKHLQLGERIDTRELRFSRAMIFAVEEINNSTEMLPGIKLGYQIYDSCASVPVAVHVAFQLSGGMDPAFYTGDNCSQSGKVMAIVGESGSTPSISMSRIIGPFNIPQVSHFATCACLSDKQQYPSFFRTIPSDQFQADALAKLVKHFSWTWIGAIRSDSDYGNNGMASFLNAAHKEGICVEYSESFNRKHPRSRIQRVADIIRRSTAIVIVAFTSPGDMRILLEELSLKPSPPRQWIGSEAWVTDPDMLSIDARELRFSRAMIFAIEEINNSTELLPGIKLGYQIYDSCASVPVAVHVAFQLSGGMDPVFYTGDNCSQSGKVMAIVGDSGSTPSISMSRIIGPFNIPQVSHFATCACLSDKQQYPTFFRTIPSDQFQADALVKLWIGSESWVTDPDMLRFSFCAGSVGFAIERSVIPGLRDFLLDFSPSKITASPMFTEFWEDAFNCRLGKTASTDKNACDGTEDIETIQSPYTDTSQLRITNMVYKAVYAIAHAIHYAVCQETHYITQCDKLSSIESKQVLTQLKKVNFSQNGYHVSFAASGDPVATYELVNWQKTESGSIELVAVGHYDASLPVGQELRIKRNLTWVEGGTQVGSPKCILHHVPNFKCDMCVGFPVPPLPTGCEEVCS
ncbi:Extracellular calcium-sensing receptor [Liparis tanakae]|uniref:Extracellular calcium-sensing receptor n=1 Tax=Liparis tanakae TaxID=230148 RepID=A0A4Z2G1F2_9TELE|nr:Extracellular calcium-sensing receptor [Liparis tanakae]